LIKALIFDFDGLIVDTEMPALQAWQQVYEEHGHTIDHNKWIEYFLGSTFDPLQHLHSLCGEGFTPEIANARRDLIKTELCDAKPLLPGITQWIDDAERLSLKLAVASSSRRPWVTHHLNRCGILDRFEVICTREDVKDAKPAPDLFQLAAQRLGIEPNEALVLEDSPNGLRAAQAAGMQCLIIPNGLTRTMAFASHRWRVVSLAEESLEQFLRRSTLG
jgi:beta-phosphoglucomutase-like phosphatase (HAD superfamily)